MIIILKDNKQSEHLVLHQNIFPRPTPYKIAYHSWWEFVRGRDTYHMIVLPPQYAKIHQFDVDIEDGEVVLRQGDREVHRTPICRMSWTLWLYYDIESYVSGLVFRFWNWRWNPGRLTREELEYTIYQLQKKSSTRITPEEEA